MSTNAPVPVSTDEPPQPTAQETLPPSSAEAPAPAPTTAAEPGAATADDAVLPPPLRADSTLLAAIGAFNEYMMRKGFSENTIKAFGNDLKILAWLSRRRHQVAPHRFPASGGLPDLDADRAGHTMQPQDAGPAHHLAEGALWLAPRRRRHRHRPGRPGRPTTGSPATARHPAGRGSQAAPAHGPGFLLSRTEADARPYLLLSLLLQTGMKKAECARLLVTDLNSANPQAPDVTIRYQDESQAHKNRVLGLNPTIVPALNQYLEQYKPESFLVRLHAAQPGICAGRVGRQGGHSQYAGGIRDPALDLRRARLPQRHARGAAPPEAGVEQDLLARDAGEGLSTGRALTLRLAYARHRSQVTLPA